MEGQVSDPLKQRITPTQRVKSFSPNDIARLVINVLHDPADKRETSLQLAGQLASLGKVHMTGDKGQQHLVLPQAIAYIDIAELSGVMYLVIWDDLKPLNCLLEKLNDTVDRLRVHRASRDVHHLMSFGHVQANEDLAS